MLHELVRKLVQLEFVAKVCKPGASLYLSPGTFGCTVFRADAIALDEASHEFAALLAQ